MSAFGARADITITVRPRQVRKRDGSEICGHAAKRWRLSFQAQLFSLTEMRLKIQKRRNLYNGIERSSSLTKNSNELASYHKTRTGFRH
jgi:hypothetical protein